jgi:hypothetical protein
MCTDNQCAGSSGAMLTARGEHVAANLRRHACPKRQAWHPIRQFSFDRALTSVPPEFWNIPPIPNHLKSQNSSDSEFL